MSVDKVIKLFLIENLGFKETELGPDLCLFSTSLLSSLDAYNLLSYVYQQTGLNPNTPLSLRHHDTLEDILSLFKCIEGSKEQYDESKA